ncbi:Fc.00g073420.m01.CDS01 [Cosmosporella sp. VM-42]
MKGLSTKACMAFLVFLILATISFAADEDATCTNDKGCEKGCCGPIDEATGKGICGTGPDYCGDDCTSECDYKAECDPGWGLKYSNATKCPLNVCCSDYGFCGTAKDFCKGKTVTSPTCSGKSSEKRTVGYYEGWNLDHPCGTMKPEEIPLGYYTHINFAFSLINPDNFHMEAMAANVSDLYDRVTALKTRDPDLEVWIATGGWAMNDPGKYRTTFSDLAKSEEAQDYFFESLITFMQNHGFDGVDLDWEYPVAEDRGGIGDDYDNFVNLLKRLRKRLNETGKRYGISITLPASYWYLKGFNIVDIEQHIDWFNIMTYDIHGTWDEHVASIGNVAQAHTNLTEIHAALELLWRNNINPERVVMGLGFYGRTFKMESADCMEAGCPFEEGAAEGECTGTSGVLSSTEIRKIRKNGGKVTFDPEAAVKIITWGDRQWASWDDAETLKLKQDFANERCLGGTMVWAIDLDDGALINALGSNMEREKKQTSNGTMLSWDLPVYGEAAHDEL